VRQALDVFANQPAIARVLHVLDEVGLGYLRLGQPAGSLSGGEAQRLRLGRERATPAGGGCVYVLDEPTTGLHFDDIRKLLDVLQRIVDRGNTLVVIEHQLDVIAQADWVIELGPEAGEDGGRIVAEGSPEAIVHDRRGHTAAFLEPVLAEYRDGRK
jgi:excinuclease ABC subunit A